MPAIELMAADCNGNGIEDIEDVVGGTSIDCNTNGLPDECETYTLFSTQQIISTFANSPRSVFAVDLDGDGDKDVLAASYLDDTISWFRNTGSPGSFGELQVISTDADGASSVFAADLDGDGDFDVLSGSKNDTKIAWYENTDGLGSFGFQKIITMTAQSTESIIAADLDGDGDADVLSASSIDDRIAWYENTDGLGNFGPQNTITTSANGAHSVFAADLDGDGDADVLSASENDDKLAWYENLIDTGDGGPDGFGTPQTISTAANGARYVFSADLDGDGDFDVLSASQFDDKVAWYENTDGLGGFGPQQIISTDTDGAAAVIAADIDDDGDNDVVSASASDHKIAWYENIDGLGGFGSQQVITTAATIASSVFATDLDGDGDTDVLSASINDDKLAWYENSVFNDCNANGAPDDCDIALAISSDCDNNGIPDGCEPDCNLNGVADACDIGIDMTSSDCQSNGVPDDCELVGNDCNFNSIPDDCDIAGNASTDCNGNNIPDDCEPAADDCNMNLNSDECDINKGSSADCNNNRVPDECELATDDCNLNLIPDGCEFAPNFTSEQVISDSADGAKSVFAVDMDNDGDLDVLSASSGDDKIAWYENTDAQGTFGPEQAITLTAFEANSAIAADIDGDGDADVLACSDFDEITWYENTDGSGSFGPGQVITTDVFGPNSLFAADLDGDGDIDVLSSSWADSKIAWYENTDGLGTFQTRPPITTAAFLAQSVYAIDLDGDGDIDVLSASESDDKIAWYENTDGLGSFGPQQIISRLADCALSVFAADLDGDGDNDVLSGSGCDDQIAWYENLDGVGGFGVKRIIASAAGNPYSVVAVDVDQDGDLDVLAALSGDNKIVWHENLNGLGSFSSAQVISTVTANPRSVFAGDLDNDGDFDVLSASASDDKIAWYKNTILNDCNNNRVPDDCDLSGATSADCNSNGVPDECDLVGNDCNANLIPDDCDIANGASLDNNTNGILDECEPDCNLNGVPDDGDIAGSTSDDCNTNGIPDECEPDCNLNGVADGCDLESLGSNDCNANGIPDECEPDCDADGITDDCEISSGASDDCNNNGLPDECEFAGGTASDCNGNGVPDDCEVQLEFGSQQIISTFLNGGASVVAADLDADGDNDVVSVSTHDDRIYWYRNADGKGDFGPRQFISADADGAHSIIAADVDGDGDIDLLSASYLDNKIAWYENTDGPGLFGAQRVISTAASAARSVFAVDLDGDADVDVLSASSSDNKIAWYENIDGHGTFGPQRVITVGADGAFCVYAADIDGDGDNDVLSASFNDDKIAWYENTDGQGIFGPQRVITTAANFAKSVFAVDLDGDGDIDVLSASESDHKIAWYQNLDGLGTFGPQIAISTIAFEAQSVFATDMDGDGDADVLAATGRLQGGLSWYENVDGLGSFGPQLVVSTDVNGPKSIIASDLDGDGDPDVLSASDNDDKIAWYENIGNDCNHNATPDECEIAQNMTADCNTNGVLDECEPPGDDCNSNGVLDECDIIGAASADCNANGVPDDCEADCDNDGMIDDCEIGFGISLDCNRNGVPDSCEIANGMSEDCNDNGVPDICEIPTVIAGDFPITNAADGPCCVFAADLDGDGDADVLSASVADDTIAWHENTDGIGTFGPRRVITTTANDVQSVIASDLDGDGDADVLSVFYLDNMIAWYENTDGAGNFGPVQVISDTALGAASVQSADIDGDGDQDVLAASGHDDTVAWFENIDGMGTFGPKRIITVDADGAILVDAADLDGDGDVDVLSASNSDYKISWYENTDGLGNFGPQRVITATIAAKSTVITADLDGDGDLDVLWSSVSNPKICWHENMIADGGGGLSGFGYQQELSTVEAGAYSLFAADLDSDGDTDVLSASLVGSRISWYENIDGIVGFGPQQFINTVGNGARSVFAADLDGDGDDDVLSAFIYSDTITWHENAAVNDCNNNRVPDDCDLASAGGTDCNGNELLDECESDFDGDGLIDGCDSCAGGMASGDSDANGILNLIDFAALEPCLSGPADSLGDGCECFDFNEDGDNDLQDFAEFQAIFSP